MYSTIPEGQIDRMYFGSGNNILRELGQTSKNVFIERIHLH